MPTRILISGLVWCTILMHSTSAPAQEAEVILKQESVVIGIAFSPGGKYLATAAETGDTHIWDVSTGKRLATLPGPKGKPMRPVFADDGRTLTVVTSQQMTTWNVPAGKLVSKRDGCTFLSRHGVVKLEDGAVHVWRGDIKSPAMTWRQPGAVWRKTGGEGTLFRPILSVDGEQAAVLFDNKLSILKLATLTERASLDLGSLSTEIESAAMSPDAKLLALGTQRGLHVWDTSGKALHEWGEG